MASAPFSSGDIVTVRGDRWIVQETQAFADCTLLRLISTAGRRERVECKLLHPFDTPSKQKLHPRVRRTSPRRWMRVFRRLADSARPYGELAAASSAAIRLYPFQLEPALAAIRGIATRILIADEVGLGKTIQAGLILAELQDRGWSDRALIVCPAGLREQWSSELSRRFRIGARICDDRALREAAGLLPPDVNPWSIDGVSIASLDFLKQPEVCAAAQRVIWDLLVVDEAHQLSANTRRAECAGSLAARARIVVLLTATPHDGDSASYRSLCSVGALSPRDQLLIFRRSRQDAGISSRRRVHLLPVRLCDAETALHKAIGDYARRVWQAATEREQPELKLVATVLSKRALSSAAVLATSLDRRLHALGRRERDPAQDVLRFDPDDDPADRDLMLHLPAFERPVEERDALTSLLRLARACTAESKLRVLRRLLVRIAEPAIVFTEYRDTLPLVAAAIGDVRRVALLHGGLDRSQRARALADFHTQAADLLLATDAGAEGLNLQEHCRLVINLELPWNPVRLEQRIGRVDRIGQRKTVHAIHLYASGTAEASILARLARRIDRIRTETDIALEVINDVQRQPAC